MDVESRYTLRRRAPRPPWSVLAIAIGIPLGLVTITNLVRLRLSPGAVYPGVFRQDMFYYLANAREIFENGNGLFYGDPFSGSFDSPRVYSHLELLILGWAWRLTDLPLATLWQVAQVVFGLTMFLSLYRLLSYYFSGRQLTYAFALISIGGGGATLQALATSMVSGPDTGFMDAYRQLLQPGVSGASWLPNVFQNASLTTQAFYHTLSFATLAAVVSGRAMWGAFGLFLIWWTHPFTGIEVGAIVGAFTLLEAMISRSVKDARAMLVMLAISVFFLLYYLILIPGLSPEAADITRRWRAAPTIFHFSDAFSMWGVFLFAPLLFFSSSTRALDFLKEPRDRLLAVWIVVVGVLIVHEIFLPSSIAPFQPLHFAHGYFFVPVAILFLRALTDAVSRLAPRMIRMGAALLLVVASLDNVAFCWNLVRTVPPILTAESARIVEFLAEYKPPSFVFVGPQTGLLFHYMMVATPHKLYLYNEFQTPFFEDKREKLRACLASHDSASACRALGLGLMILPNARIGPLKRDIAANRARVAFRTQGFSVVELRGESDRPGENAPLQPY